MQDTPKTQSELIIEGNFGTIGKPQLKEVLIKECLITIFQEKNIVCTPINGKEGTIKEYISDGDYQITLDVGLSNVDFFNLENNTKHQEYPLDKVAELIKFLKLDDSLIVHNDILKMFGVYNIIVKGYTVPQETHSNRQTLSINCLSELPYEIKQKNEKI